MARYSYFAYTKAHLTSAFTLCEHIILELGVYYPLNFTLYITVWTMGSPWLKPRPTGHSSMPTTVLQVSARL